MRERDIKKLLLAIRTERCKVDVNIVPGWDYAHLSHLVTYCYESGLIRAIEVTNMQSLHPLDREFIAPEITALGEDWLQERTPLKRFGILAKMSWKSIVSVLGVLVMIIAIWQYDKVRGAVSALIAHLRH